MASFLAIGVLVYILWQKTNKIADQNAAAYLAFAAKNGYEYTKKVASPNNGTGTLFTHGHSAETSNMLSGTHSSGLPMQLFHYQYDTGSGKNRTTHYASIARLTLPRAVPHMVIDSLVENSTDSVLPIQFDSSQQVRVEGDFNQYFALYAPDTYAVSMLSIIGPDVMWALMQHAAACDIEIIDNYVYFYWPLTAQTANDYERMFATINAVMSEVGRKLTKGNIYTSTTQAQLHSEAKTQGVRLKRDNSVPLMVGGFLVLYVLSMFWPEWAGPIVGPIFMCGIVAIIITASVQSNRKRKRRETLLQRFHTNDSK
jgi:hypothetical protein